MCGILGGNNKTFTYEMGIRAMQHRGPDGIKIEKLPEFTLAFARLAIIDLNERAMQPMHTVDQNVWIVYNGEIYNYKELKKELQKKYEFRTISDTEVILNAYMEYGDKFIDHIDGMFAIAIYDLRTQELKLFRDRVGIKPLYYYNDGKYFAFSSELKALEYTLPQDRLRIDYTALYDYLFYEYIPAPKTMYVNCFKLPPACKLTYSLINRKITSYEKYWKLHINTTAERKRNKKDIEEAIRYYITKSVKEQMVADVAVGTYLSGGIDSSIISYHCHEFDNGVNTFSIGFKDKKMDETPYAKIMKNRYNIKFINRILDRDDIQNVKGQMREWFDEPFADCSAYPTYILSQMAKEKVTVVLTGDGGDELFGGYPSCKLMKDIETNKYKDRLKDFCFGVRHKGGVGRVKGSSLFRAQLEKFYGTRCAFKNKEIEILEKKWNIRNGYDVLWNLKRYYKNDLPPVTRSRYLDFKTYLPDDVLTKVDRTSMAVSLEARVPFLARELLV